MQMKLVSLGIFFLILIPIFSGCLEEQKTENHPPIVNIIYPNNTETVSSIVKVTGTAVDEDGEKTLVHVEIKINNTNWEMASGTTQWSYDWDTYQSRDGVVSIYVRAWDGQVYSEVETIDVLVLNPEATESDAHKWAVFVIAANFPDNNESKLGNGGLYLAEEMAAFFIENYNYPTSNVFILFDDGWIRNDNGYGQRIETLAQRPHEYDIHYSGATKQNVEAVIYRVVEQANRYGDSEVFLWFAGHGTGDNTNDITGGKILERSAIFLWDDSILTDRELGQMLYSLRSDKTCIIVDACFSGGFVDRTLYDFPTFFLLHSGISGSGRVAISGASKFRQGYASTTRGPLFSLLWFEGIKTGDADGYQPGFRSTGKPPRFGLFVDGEVSVEEAFYYARYVLRTDESLQNYKTMEPQINDQYPHRGILRDNGEMILGD